MGVVILAAVAWWGLRSDTTSPDAYTVIHEEVVADVTVRLLAGDRTGGLSQGRSRFVLEFRDESGELSAVREVRVSSSMAMPGMVMTAPVSAAPAGRGRVEGTAEFSMSGTWRFTVEWTGASGPRSVAFDGDVR